MLTRFHKILGAVLVLQLALALLFHLRGNDRAVASEPALLTAFDPAKVTRIQIINDSKSLDLVKKGETWVVASAFDYPVMKERIDDALTPLARITTGTPIATQTTRHKQLLVDDHEFGSKVMLTIDGKDTALYIGGGGGKRVAVRRGGDQNVYGAAGVTMGTFSGHATNWIDTKYLTLEREAVTAIKIERGGTTFDLAKGNPWTSAVDGVALPTTDASAVDAVLDSLIAITLDEPADPKRDASKPTATVTITTAAAPIVLDLIEVDARVWVRQRGTERAILVDKGRFAAVLTLTRDRLQQKLDAPPPTPSP